MQKSTKLYLSRFFDENPALSKKIIRTKNSWDEVAKLLNADKKPKKKKK